jgi:pimeloyl-ACP methyl ester carboxylesterase
MSSSPLEADSGPPWFRAAVADTGETRDIEVDGARVEYRVWGPAGAPVVVLVHGGAAHGGWWDHLAPTLASGRRVAALDLTGHGSSDRRASYDFRTWSDEIAAVGVVEAAGHRFHVIGHSMGGVASLTTAHRHRDRVAGTVVIDPPDWLVTEGGLDAARVELAPRRAHADADLASSRFRARPEDPARTGYVERHVARRSVHLVDDGWTWRFDPEVTRHSAFPENLWGGDHGPVVLVRAERGLMTEAQATVLLSRLGDVAAVTIHDSGHHVMLDQPVALSGCLQGLLAAWSVVRPAVRPVRTGASTT